VEPAKVKWEMSVKGSLDMIWTNVKASLALLIVGTGLVAL
jgi:hypothetical protein